MRGSEIGTRDWDPKAAVTAPVTASAVAAVTTAVPEIDTYTLGSPTSGTLSFAYGGTTYSAAFNSTSEQTLIDLKTAINDGAAGSSVTASTTSNDKLIITADVASATQMTKGTITGGSTITIADTAVGAALTGEQESYDFSSITLAQGDRVSLTIGTTTYTQEFTADQATTLSALGAKVVNGDASYVSKTVDTDGKLVFTGAAIGTALAAATTAVETSSVAAANSVDDILVTDAASAKAALAVVDSALEMMSDFRARLGASSNRMFITVDNLMSMSENTAAARSRIVDADFAAESASLAKSQILQKAGTAMLSQANASTQDILSLLK
jgi:flagellin